MHTHRDMSACACALQGGTCVVIGDAHEWVAEASRLVQERINCTIYPMEAFYRQEGHSQVSPPLCSRLCIATCKL